MDGERRPARRYLFLQGMPTTFLGQLGAVLAGRGHIVHRINFTAGDRLFWRLPGSVSYRGSLDEWPRFIEERLTDWRITDIVLFGDWRPLHAAAIRIATLRGLAVHVFEEGYLRPFWITLEQGGVNNNSSLPRDPATFLSEAAFLPPWRDAVPVDGFFRVRAVQDVAYHVWSWLCAWRYPGYRSHIPVHPFVEYAGWIRRFVRAPRLRRRAQETIQELATSGRPYYVLPLQLDSDSQLRVNSTFGGLAPAIDAILQSFATHAPADAVLLLKEHPLDNQLIDWEAQARAEAERLGIAGRVLYLVGGNIDDLMRQSRGVVTVNSTSGFQALALGTPVVALSRPIYAVPGLTFQGGLDRFWREGRAPDRKLFDAFRRVVAHRTQLNGGFFSAQASAMATAGAVERLEAFAWQHPVAVYSLAAATPTEIESETALAKGGAG